MSHLPVDTLCESRSYARRHPPGNRRLGLANLRRATYPRGRDEPAPDEGRRLGDWLAVQHGRSLGPAGSPAVAEVRGRIVAGALKTHAAQSVTLPGFLAVRLGEYLPRRTGLAFPDRDGGPLRVTNWNRRTFTPAAVIAGLVPPLLRVHDLRHTAASLMIASGASVKVVQQQLGHRAAAMTLDRYAHLFPDEHEALSSALDGLKARTPADSLRTVDPVADLRSRRA